MTSLGGRWYADEESYSLWARFSLLEYVDFQGLRVIVVLFWFAIAAVLVMFEGYVWVVDVEVVCVRVGICVVCVCVEGEGVAGVGQHTYLAGVIP